MDGIYEDSIETEWLRLSEIIESVIEIRPDESQLESWIDTNEGRSVRIEHPLAIVLNPDCDLEWDVRARLTKTPNKNKYISHVILCDLEDEFGIRNRVSSTTMHEMIMQNGVERYHFLPKSAAGTVGQLGEYYIDFKKMYTIHRDFLYAMIESGRTRRIASLEARRALHLADRFTYFLGRVGLSDVD